MSRTKTAFRVRTETRRLMHQFQNSWLTAQEAATLVGLERKSVLRQLGRMERAGLVKRKRLRDDRSEGRGGARYQIMFKLTDRGQEALLTHVPCRPPKAEEQGNVMAGMAIQMLLL